MGRRNLPGNAALKTAEMPGLGKLWPVWGVLVACVWTAFSPALSNGFVDWDDPQWILENYSFRGLGWEQIAFAFTSFKGGVYQPLGWLVQSLTYQIYGLEPRGYHLVSLVFHATNVVLLHLLCVRLVEKRMPDLAARLGAAFGWLCGIPVLLSAVHPLRVEMVAWASPQAYLPGITLSLLATLAYLQAHPPSGDFRRSWMTGSSFLIVLAVLTKGSAVVLPFVFLILDAYPLRRLGSGRPTWPSVRNAVFEKIPLLAFCFAFALVAFAAKYRWLEPDVTNQPLFAGRVAQASFGACFYVIKTIWPFGITAFYPRPEGENFVSPLFAACFVRGHAGRRGGDPAAPEMAVVAGGSGGVSLDRRALPRTGASQRHAGVGPLLPCGDDGLGGYRLCRALHSGEAALVFARTAWGRRWNAGDRRASDDTLLGAMPRLGKQRAPLESRSEPRQGEPGASSLPGHGAWRGRENRACGGRVARSAAATTAICRGDLRHGRFDGAPR